MYNDIKSDSADIILVNMSDRDDYREIKTMAKTVLRSDGHLIFWHRKGKPKPGDVYRILRKISGVGKKIIIMFHKEKGLGGLHCDIVTIS